jgi:DUF1680 family protein
VAVQRGPLVYCLESPDLPDGVGVQDILVPTDTKLVPQFDPNLLNGMTVIEASLLAQPAGDWNGKLYRPLNDVREQPVDVRLIPYYAWSNRGESEMSVWLPVR